MSSDLAIVYAALILKDDNVEVTVSFVVGKKKQTNTPVIVMSVLFYNITKN